MFSVKVEYIDSTGRQMGYNGAFSTENDMYRRFNELGIINIIKLEIRQKGESEYKVVENLNGHLSS